MVTPEDDSRESAPPDTVPTMAIGPGAIDARPAFERRMIDVDPPVEPLDAAPVLRGDRRTGDDVVPSTFRVTVRVMSGSKPCSIIRARASADTVSSAPPFVLRRTRSLRDGPRDERRTLTERDAVRGDADGRDPVREGVESDAESSDPGPGRTEALTLAPVAEFDGRDDPEGPGVEPDLSVRSVRSRCGGRTIGATGKSSGTERRIAAGRGAVAAR